MSVRLSRTVGGMMKLYHVGGAGICCRYVAGVGVRTGRAGPRRRHRARLEQCVRRRTRKCWSRTNKTGEERTALTERAGLFRGRLAASRRPTRSRWKRPASAIIEYTAMPVATGQELTLDFELQAGRRAGIGDRRRHRAGARHQLGAARRERQRARGQELPVNGRQMSQLMLQAPGAQNAGTGTWQDVRFSGRANEQNVIKYDGIEGSAIIDASPGNVNGENQHALQAAGEPRERPGVPRRVEQLSGRVRHRHRRPGERHHQVGRQRLPRRDVRVPAQR